MVALFKKYADMYGFDYLMIGAQAYQESKLDHSVVSPSGAVGVMQILPSTAADPAVGIPDIQDLENNIHAGVKYLHHIYENTFKEAEMDIINKGLFAFAAYNAGPKKIQDFRQTAIERGLDPNIWFQNVERIAAEVIGRETVQYVQNIYKYYIAYTLIIRQAALRQTAE
jgi:membrane-bound lytic murein transglycosylase MltF